MVFFFIICCCPKLEYFSLLPMISAEGKIDTFHALNEEFPWNSRASVNLLIIFEWLLCNNRCCTEALHTYCEKWPLCHTFKQLLNAVLWIGITCDPMGMLASYIYLLFSYCIDHFMLRCLALHIMKARHQVYQQRIHILGDGHSTGTHRHEGNIQLKYLSLDEYISSNSSTVKKKKTK